MDEIKRCSNCGKPVDTESCWCGECEDAYLISQWDKEGDKMDYKMIVEIPIRDVPDNISIQEAKVESEIWLKGKIPDAELTGFEEARNG